MGIVSHLKSVFSSSKPEAPGTERTFDVEEFIYIKIPGAIGPIDRGELFEDRIDPVLAQADLGAVSGGGSSLGDPQPDGSRLIQFCGIDVNTKDRRRALVVLHELLPSLNVPCGTELHYTRSGVKLQDTLSVNGWLIEQSRNFLHPGFSI